LLNELSVTELAELSKLSKAYISQVKHGKRPASEKLLEALNQQSKPRQPNIDYFTMFLQSRKAMGVSPRTLAFYKERLSKFIVGVDYLKASKQAIERIRSGYPSCLF
jgi:transcriptional regulator with XRE-family HTH domain